MPQLTPHNVLRLIVITFIVSIIGLWITFRSVDPETSPVAAWILMISLAVIGMTSFLAPLVYIVKKAKLRGHITGATVIASTRQSLWFSLLIAGCWALWIFRALTPLTFLLSALGLFLTELAARSWTQKPGR